MRTSRTALWMALLLGWSVAQATTLTLAGREWTVIPTDALPAPLHRDTDLPGLLVADATIELTEPLDASARDEVFILAATFMAEDGACVGLEIGFPSLGGGELVERTEVACTAAPGRWTQIALAARAGSLAKTVRYRLTVRGSARLRDTELLAGPGRTSSRALRARVAASTIEVIDTTLREVKARARRASQLDWPLATAQALARVVDGSTRRDALPGVQLLLKALGDRHSWATVLDEQGRLTNNGQVVPYRAPQSRLQVLDEGHTVGWLTLPFLVATGGQEAQTYADRIRAGVAQAVDAGACGLVVDLVGHEGGNMWPGLEGLGPVFGADAMVGGFKPGSPWRIDKTGDERLWREDVAQLPVAVLIGPRTASSGEALAAAFSGRPQTEFFGRKTRGLATSNQMVPLGDGLVAFIMTSEMADRHGRTFPGGLVPPVEDASDEAASARALAWLGAQAGCIRPSPAHPP